MGADSGEPAPRPPILGEPTDKNRSQSPPELGDLGGRKAGNGASFDWCVHGRQRLGDLGGQIAGNGASRDVGVGFDAVEGGFADAIAFADAAGHFVFAAVFAIGEDDATDHAFGGFANGAFEGFDIVFGGVELGEQHVVLIELAAELLGEVHQVGDADGVTEVEVGVD